MADTLRYDKILLIHGCEPPEINDVKNYVVRHGKRITKVYSFDNDVLKHVKGSELFCFGSCWIISRMKKDFEDHFDMEKDFKLSFIKSEKQQLQGHKLRHEIEGLLSKKYPFEIFFPKKRIESKLPLFKDSMFHVVVENCRCENYFTEKIIDCMISYTVPLYCGCPNISGHFEADGIIQFGSKEELEDILNRLTPDDYYRRAASIKKNHEIAKDRYAFFFDRVNQFISTL
jgi:hypothetical protein